MTKRDDVDLLLESVACLIIAALLLWAALADAQPTSLNLNGQPLTAIRCDGGVVCSRRGSVADIIVTASGGGGTSDFDGGYNLVQDEGAPLTKRSTIDFTGAGVTCTDTGAKTACDIPSGGSGGASPLSLILGTP